MIEIKLFGQPTSTYEYAKKTLVDEVEKAGISIRLQEVNDVNSYISEGVRSVPTFRINEKKDVSYSQKSDFTQFVKDAIYAVMREGDFGNLPKIMVPVDYSDTSSNALDYAIQIAKTQDYVVKVVHVYHPVTAEFDGVTMIDPHVEQVKRKEFHAYVNSRIEDQDLKPYIQGEFIVGYAAEEIVNSSKDNAAFITMGSTGAGTFKKWFGSVSLEVMKKAHVPILLIPSNREYSHFSSVLYASDQTDLDRCALKHLSKILPMEDVPLHILHVEQDIHESEEALKECIPDGINKDQVIIKQIASDNIVEGIRQYSIEKNIDLIVMTRKTRKFWDKFFHSSVTNKMATYSEIPLLVFHEDEELRMSNRVSQSSSKRIQEV